MANKVQHVTEQYKAPFPTNLRKLMKDRTQEEVSAAIGVSRQSMSNYMRGISNPDADTLVRMSRYFDTSLDDLLGITRTENDPDMLRKLSCWTGLSGNALQHLGEIVELSSQPNPYGTTLLEEVEALFSSESCLEFLTYTSEYRSGIYDLYAKLFSVRNASDVEKRDAAVAADSGLKKLTKILKEQLGSYFFENAGGRFLLEKISDYLSEYLKNHPEV